MAPSVPGGASAYTYDGNLRRVKSVSCGKTVYTVYSKLTGGLIYRDEVDDNKKDRLRRDRPAGLLLIAGRSRAVLTPIVAAYLFDQERNNCARPEGKYLLTH